ncbi:MAG: ATP-binding protein [Bacteroidales bacterium]|nr:ATP-binding protein [Bacteroidales bacterium]
MNELIGREKEIRSLTKWENSGRPEFVAIYGRRRVGKTFLVKKHFDERICFYVSGTYKGKRQVQLMNFAKELSDRTGKPFKSLKDWTTAFWALEDYLKQLPDDGSRKVIFLDELPWLETQRSGFVRSLDYFWNHYLSSRSDCMLVVCGSATSWMVNSLINDKGGLHNRITHEIHLNPFTLREMEMYMESQGFKWNRLLMLQTYMILGGIPYYLDMLDKDEPFSVNIDNLMFAEDAPLRTEFKRLYDSLFGKSEQYRAIISLLSKTEKGLTRKEISEKLKTKSGNLSEMLSDLVNCDFVRYYHIRKKKINVTQGIYQLTDFFTLFHYEYLAKRPTSGRFWTEHINSQKISSWQGRAFERVCMAHIDQIKYALHIDTVPTEYFSWRSEDPDMKAQIDMVIELDQGITHICEMKFDSHGDYELDKDEAEKIRRRMKAYSAQTKSKNGLRATLVTTYGLAKNVHSSTIDKLLTLDDLFCI